MGGPDDAAAQRQGPQLTDSTPSNSSATQLPTTSPRSSPPRRPRGRSPPGVLAVNRPLGDRQAPEGLDRPRRDPVGETSSSYQLTDVLEGAVGMLLRGGHRRPSAPTPLISTSSVVRSKATFRARKEAVSSCSGAPAATRLARNMSPAAPPTGWKWTWVKGPAPETGAPSTLRARWRSCAPP